MITEFRRDKIQKETEIIQAAFCVWYQSTGALVSFVTGGEKIKCFVKPISLTLNNARRIIDGAVVTRRANAFQHCGLN